nr:integrase core domain-containing protein [Bradyrhizobium sp. CCBAU 51627]
MILGAVFAGECEKGLRRLQVVIHLRGLVDEEHVPGALQDEAGALYLLDDVLDRVLLRLFQEVSNAGRAKRPYAVLNRPAQSRTVFHGLADDLFALFRLTRMEGGKRLLRQHALEAFEEIPHTVERLFRERGLPLAIRSDNGVPFASPNALFNLSKLSVWWLRLGIAIERIKPGHPQQNGRHERMHLTLKKEATRPPRFNSLQQQERFEAFRGEFNIERPHEALNMKCPAELYTASPRPYSGLPELTYPFHDRDVLVTNCGRLCLHRKKINISVVLAGQKLGIKEVDDGIWLVSFMHYDLGYFDLEQRTLQPLDNQFGPKPITRVSGTTSAS